VFGVVRRLVLCEGQFVICLREGVEDTFKSVFVVGMIVGFLP